MNALKKAVKWVLIAIGVLFILGLVVSLMSPEGRRGIEQGADAALGSTAATATEAPTPEPTATPTQAPIPTLKPTPEEAASSGVTEWMAYTDDRLAWLEGEFTPAMEAWDTDGPDVFVNAMDAIEVWSAVLAEQTDLAFVDPHPCFEDFHNEWVAIIDLYYEGYDILTDGGIESDVAMIEEGIALIDQANARMDPHTESMADVLTACG